MGDAGWNRQHCECGAAGKGAGANVQQAQRQADIGHAPAIGEGLLPDASDGEPFQRGGHDDAIRFGLVTLGRGVTGDGDVAIGDLLVELGQERDG